MKTLVGVNTLTDVAQEVYASHCQFWSRTVKQFPNDHFLFYTPRRTSIDRMRNLSAKVALENECDYLMFIDDDVIIEPHTFKSLHSTGLDIVMAHTYIRGYPFEPMCFKYVVKDEEKQSALEYYRDVIKDAKDGVSLCDAIGFSCALIKVDLLKKMLPPYFVTIGGQSTEDVYFCIKARREIGESVSIGVDTRVPTHHLLEKVFVTEKNVAKLREDYELENGKPVEKSPDRKLEDIQAALKALDQ